MQYIQAILILLFALIGGASASYIAWTRRLKHVWPKRNQIKIVNRSGLWTGIWEVLSQKKVIANRPGAGVFHFAVFYGFVSFGVKSVTHFFTACWICPIPSPWDPWTTSWMALRCWCCSVSLRWPFAATP